MNAAKQKTDSGKLKNIIKNKIRKPKKGALIIYSIIAILFVCAAIYLVVTMLFNVDRITVTGNTMYENSDIIRTSGINKGDNLFDIDIQYAKDKLYSVYSYVEDVEVKRNFPNQVVLEITEAEAFAALEDSDGYTLLSKRGKILDRGLESISKNIITVRGISSVSNTEEDKKKFELLKTIMTYLEKLGMKRYGMIDLSDTLDMVLIYEDRVKVEVGNELELEYKLQFADMVISEKIPEEGFYLVDASTPGKVMTKELSMSPWESLEKVISNGYADEEEE